MSRDVLLFADVLDGRTLLAGELTFETNAGGSLVATSFRYTDDWLQDRGGYELCPELRLTEARQRFTGERVVPGAVADTAPDQWGKNLLFRVERLAARSQNRPLRQLTDADFVLGVDDRTRMGNLRFADPSGTGASFLAPPHDGIPTLLDLHRLVDAASHLGRPTETTDDLRLLAQAGTSAGGARPKVGVHDGDGHLAIAKLPERDDNWDVEAWEAVALELARDGGLSVPRFELQRIDVDRSVLVTRRFDRQGERRLAYISANTLLEARPGEAVSYTELVDVASDIAADPRELQSELFARVAHTLLVSNVDDHMRNHGFLRTSTGWRLSPIFDVNPWPPLAPTESTPITPGGSRSDRSVEELVEAAEMFGLPRDEAVARIVAIEAATANWAEVAAAYGTEDPEHSVVASAFENPNRDVVRGWVAHMTVDDVRSMGSVPRTSSDGWVRPHVRGGRSVRGYRRHAGRGRES